MYSAGFVVSIVLPDGQILEERDDGVVAVPYDTEYKIRLRNKNDRAAVASIKIDQENVSEGGIVVYPGRAVELDRRVDKPTKFKFVSSKSEEAEEAGKANRPEGNNGVIEVSWRLQAVIKQPEVVEHHHHHYPFPANPDPWPIKPYRPWYRRDIGGMPDSYNMSSPPSRSLKSCERGTSVPVANTSKSLAEGCTVEGGRSNQTFRSVYIDLEGPAVIMKLILRGFYESERESVALYCTKYGKKLKRSDNFCGKCGLRA